MFSLSSYFSVEYMLILLPLSVGLYLLGVGYELAYAEAHGKEVHIFYRPKETMLSAMLSGNEYFHIHQYDSEEELLAQVRAF